MPIYEYQCQACGHHVEVLQKISEDPLKDCPQCGQPQLSRLISAAGFRLKGGGWYETDFKQGKRRNVAGESGGDSGGGSSDSAGSSTSSESTSGAAKSTSTTD
jgi:putative FmdB family regulatory protein